MKRRREKRTAAVLPVKVSSRNAPQFENKPAHTLDVAWKGARLSGLHFGGPLGSVITLERGNRKVEFRVAWIGEAGTPRAGQIGLESMEPARGLWGVDIPAPVEETPPIARTHSPGQAPAEVAGEVSSVRYHCKGEVTLRKEGQYAQPLKGKLRDISARGCFILSNAKLPLNTRLQIVLKAEDVLVHARASVRAAEPQGMWLDFFDLEGEERADLAKLLEKLASQSDAYSI